MRFMPTDPCSEGRMERTEGNVRRESVHPRMVVARGEIKDDFSILRKGKRLKINATVDADGIARLKQVLEKYEEIRKLLQSRGRRLRWPALICRIFYPWLLPRPVASKAVAAAPRLASQLIASEKTRDFVGGRTVPSSPPMRGIGSFAIFALSNGGRLFTFDQNQNRPKSWSSTRKFWPIKARKNRTRPPTAAAPTAFIAGCFDHAAH